MPRTHQSVRRYREEEGGGAQRFQLDIRDHPEQITEKIAAYERVSGVVCEPVAVYEGC